MNSKKTILALGCGAALCVLSACGGNGTTQVVPAATPAASAATTAVGSTALPTFNAPIPFAGNFSSPGQWSFVLQQAGATATTCLLSFDSNGAAINPCNAGSAGSDSTGSAALLSASLVAGGFGTNGFALKMSSVTLLTTASGVATSTNWVIFLTGLSQTSGSVAGNYALYVLGSDGNLGGPQQGTFIGTYSLP